MAALKKGSREKSPLGSFDMIDSFQKSRLKKTSKNTDVFFSFLRSELLNTPTIRREEKQVFGILMNHLDPAGCPARGSPAIISANI